MTTAPETFASAIHAIQHMADQSLLGHVVNENALIGIASLCKRVLADVRNLPTQDRISPMEQRTTQQIQDDLNRAYPQGWVLAWTEAVTMPPINPSDGRPPEARTTWGDGCRTHGSVSQTLGLATFMLDSIKANIVRKNA